jgi:hypothetical protein
MHFGELSDAENAYKGILDDWRDQGVMVQHLTAIKSVGLLTRHMVYIYRIAAISDGRMIAHG